MERKAERQKHQRQSHTNWLPAAAAAAATKMCGMKQANNTDNCGSAAGSAVERSHMQRTAKALSEANVENISKTKTKSMYSHMQPHMCVCLYARVAESSRQLGSNAATATATVAAAEAETAKRKAIERNNTNEHDKAQSRIHKGSVVPHKLPVSMYVCVFTYLFVCVTQGGPKGWATSTTTLAETPAAHSVIPNTRAPTALRAKPERERADCGEPRAGTEPSRVALVSRCRRRRWLCLWRLYENKRFLLMPLLLPVLCCCAAGVAL